MRSGRSTRGLAALGAALLALAGADPAGAADLENGKRAYATNCVTCHGEKGDGKGPAGLAIQPPPRDFSSGAFAFDTDKDGKTGTDADLMAVIKNGAMVYGGSPLMTPWAHLSEKDIADLVAYIRTLRSGSTAAAVAEGATPVRATP